MWFIKALEWMPIKLLILFKIKYTHGATFWVVLGQDIDWEICLPPRSYIHLIVPTVNHEKESLWLMGPNFIIGV